MRSVAFKPTKISSPSLRIGKNAVGGTVYEEMEFTGFAGLNNKSSNVEIADNEASDLLNVEFDALGAITKRKGYTLVNDFGTQQVNSIIPFYKSTGARVLIVTYGSSIVQYDPISGVTTPITTTLHGSGLRFSGAIDTPHDKIYLTNGDTTDGLMSWDGTNLTKIVGAPNGKYVLYYKNHLYVAGDPSAPYRLYISDQGDPTTWPVNNYEDLTDGIGGITGMKQLGDSLVLFKEKDAFLMKGEDPSDYVFINTYAGGKGCVSHWSIVQIENGLIYLSRDGVYLFTGAKFELISDKIQGSINNWNQQQLQNAVAFEYDHKYWLSVPDGIGQVVNNNTYVFSYLYGWWTKHNIAAQTFAVLTTTQMEPTPYFTDTSGDLFQADNGDNDNGAAIDGYLITKAYNFGTSAHMKSFKGVQMTALATTGNYNLSMSFIEDFGLQTKTVQMPLGLTNPSLWGVMVWGKDVWGGYGEVTHLTTNVPGAAKYLQFKVEGADINAPFTFLGWVVRFKVKRRLQ